MLLAIYEPIIIETKFLALKMKPLPLNYMIGFCLQNWTGSRLKSYC